MALEVMEAGTVVAARAGEMNVAVAGAGAAVKDAFALVDVVVLVVAGAAAKP